MDTGSETPICKGAGLGISSDKHSWTWPNQCLGSPRQHTYSWWHLRTWEVTAPGEEHQDQRPSKLILSRGWIKAAKHMFKREISTSRYGIKSMASLSGIYTYLWLIHADIWQKLTQYCKAIIFQVKINKIKYIFFKVLFIILQMNQWKSKPKRLITAVCWIQIFIPVNSTTLQSLIWILGPWSGKSRLLPVGTVISRGSGGLNLNIYLFVY